MINSLKDDNQGVAFVAVMMAMLVLSILSVAVLSMTTSNLKNGLEEREFQSVYYVAEGGVNYYTEEVKDEILKSYNSTSTPDDFFDAIENGRIDTLINKSTELYDTQYGNQPEVEMVLKKDGVHSTGSTSRTYIIESKAMLDGVVRKVEKPITINWKNKTNWKYKYAVQTFGNLNITGGLIDGDVYSSANIVLNNGGMKINGDVYAEGDITIEDAHLIDGNIYAKGDVIINQLSKKDSTDGCITGNVYAEGEIITSGLIEGDAYAQRGSITILTGNDKDVIRIGKNAYAYGNITSPDNTPDGIADGNIGESINANLSSVSLPDFPESPGKGEDGKYPDFPEFPIQGECTVLESQNYGNGANVLDLTSQKTYIPDLKVSGGATLTIEYDDKSELMVDNFEGSNNSTIFLKPKDTDSKGKLILYINNQLKIADCPLNYVDVSAMTNEDAAKAEKETSDKLEIYSKVNGEGITIENGPRSRILTKLLYAPEAKIPLAGDGSVSGPVLANDVQISGSHASNVEHDPDAGEEGSDDLDDVDELVNISPVREY